jgi:hypothetical protein
MIGSIFPIRHSRMPLFTIFAGPLVNLMPLTRQAVGRTPWSARVPLDPLSAVPHQQRAALWGSQSWLQPAFSRLGQSAQLTLKTITVDIAELIRMLTVANSPDKTTLIEMSSQKRAQHEMPILQSHGR